MNTEPKKRNITYSGYAITVPEPYDNNLVLIKPHKEAPEALAVFPDLRNAESFVSLFKIDKKYIVPVIIVRTDATQMVE